jgi:hypothetical protein
MIKLATFLVIIVSVCLGLGGELVGDESQAPKSETTGISWLDNGQIRLGVDLSIGGAITHLSDATTKVNMINSHDWGRQIQMSFYSGPVPFVPDGATVAPNWKGLGWNPIQSGDCYGFRSRIVEHRNDGETLYVRSVPQHWPLKNVPGQCEFECWFRLEGPTVQATSRLNNHRSDQTQYPARSQELPAVYTNGPWYKLVSYLGSQPFTGAAPTVLVDRKDGKGWPWRTFYSPEHWAALVDKNDRGVGIYLPGACAFTGGFSGQKGEGGPKDGPTGHMTPRHIEILDHNIVFTYQYSLIVGSLKEIRKYVYNRHGKGALPQWRFAADRQHWLYRNADDDGWPIRDCLVVRMGSKDAALVSPKTCWQAEEAPRLYVRAAFETEATSATVAFRPFDDVDAGDWPAWGESRRPRPGPVGRASFAIQGDGQVRTIEIDLSAHQDYRGPMTQLQLLLPGEGSAKIYSVGFHEPAK